MTFKPVTMMSTPVRTRRHPRDRYIEKPLRHIDLPPPNLGLVSMATTLALRPGTRATLRESTWFHPRGWETSDLTTALKERKMKISTLAKGAAVNLMTAVSLYEEGLLSEDDALWFARELVTSGLVNSTGTYQRFVASVIEKVSPENFYMDGELSA